MSPATLEKARVMAVVFLVGCVVFGLREWLVGERSQGERDAAQARNDPRCRKPEPLPPWFRVWRRKMMAMEKLGETKRKRAA
jgi:hypothetical protein